MENELSYWLALAHSQNVSTKTKNEIIVKLYNTGQTVIDFFHADLSSWSSDFGLTEEDISHFTKAKMELANYAFLVESLLSQGYNIIPITSKQYSPSLKKNLGKSLAPPLLYTKGNIQLFKEDTIAIFGTQKPHDNSLGFTDAIAQKSTKKAQAVVSGFAKGVDKYALDSALKYDGRAIIVLPQGISTFTVGYRNYYQQIIQGKVLVVSSFPPNTPFNLDFNTERNLIIYGLASEIYVADSSEKDGSWPWLLECVKRGKKVFVRNPETGEKNANGLLIREGAQAVNGKGEPIYLPKDESTSTEQGSLF